MNRKRHPLIQQDSGEGMPSPFGLRRGALKAANDNAPDRSVVIRLWVGVGAIAGAMLAVSLLQSLAD